MEIPISIFYFIYLGFVIFFLLFTFFNIYHLIRFGSLTIANISIIIFFIVVTPLILAISWGYINQIDWQQGIPITPQLSY